MTLRIFRYFQGGSRWLQITCLEWKPREVVGVPTEYLTNFSARTRRLKLKTEERWNTPAEKKTNITQAYFTQVAVSSWTSLHSYNQTSEMEGSKLRDWNTRLNMLKHLSYEDNSNEKNKWRVKRWESSEKCKVASLWSLNVGTEADGSNRVSLLSLNKARWG